MIRAELLPARIDPPPAFDVHLHLAQETLSV